jgi:hypothetical protein
MDRTGSPSLQPLLYGFDLGLQQAMPLLHLYFYMPLGKVMVKLLKLTKQQLDMLPSLPMHPLLSLMMVDKTEIKT